VATSGLRFHPVVAESGDGNDTVEGSVFEVTDAELAAADAYEVSDYKRVAARLRSGETAWVYVRA
jgi:gamma-glutamylcyclotransferase (GGCT)/AIG2-like uncharacterized protein YtfP